MLINHARGGGVADDEVVYQKTRRQSLNEPTIKNKLKIDGRAAVVVPDNVLFEGGAGEKIRRKLLQSARSTRSCACPPASSTRRG